MGDIIGYIVGEGRVLKKAPILCACLLLLGAGIGRWYDSEKLSDKDNELHRYRVALGVDPASKGALIELTDKELSLKARSTVANLRRLDSDLQVKLAAIQQQLEQGKIKPEDADKAKTQAMHDVSQDYDRNLASEALNVDEELRKRIDPKAMEHILRVPALVGSDGERIPFAALMRGTGFDTFYIRGLANEIEQMTNLLSGQ